MSIDEDISHTETKILHAEMAVWGEKTESKRRHWRFAGGFLAIFFAIAIPIFLAGVIYCAH